MTGGASLGLHSLLKGRGRNSDYARFSRKGGGRVGLRFSAKKVGTLTTLASRRTGGRVGLRPLLNWKEVSGGGSLASEEAVWSRRRYWDLGGVSDKKKQYRTSMPCNWR